MSKYPYNNEPLNIFETMWKESSKIEPYHSGFLASVLANKRAQMFLAEFIKLAVDESESIPSEELKKLLNFEEEIPKIESEFVIDNGRVDVVLHFPSQHTVIAVEIKTTDKSTTSGQLEKYYNGLVSLKKLKNQKIYTVYLTPFNTKNLKEIPEKRIHALTEFDKFKKTGHPCVHINWQQVAFLYKFVECRETQVLLAQHKHFIDSVICNRDLFSSILMNRELADFVGDSTFQLFDSFIRGNNIVKNDSDDHKYWSFSLDINADKYHEILRALELLVDGDGIKKSTRRKPQVTEQLLDGFKQQAEHSAFFRELFLMLEEKPYVYMKGITDIGIRAVSNEMGKDFSLFSISYNEVIFVKNR